MWARVLASVSAVLVLAALGALPAAAADTGPLAKTTVAFVGSTTIETGFGGDWSLRLRVTTPTGPIGSEDGTVDITVAGLSGLYATDLPIAGNGDVYVAAPDGKPALAAGAHQLTAFFRPATASGFAPSHTDKAALVTVSSLTAVATVSMLDVDALAPKAKLALTGTWQSTTKNSPPGSWIVTVATPAKVEVASTTVAQPTTSLDAVLVPIDTKLARGQDYIVTARFEPDPSVSAGLTVTQPLAVTFHVPDLSFAEAASQPVTTKVAVPVVAGAALVGLIVAIILIGVRLRRRRAAERHDRASATEPDGDETEEDQPI